MIANLHQQRPVGLRLNRTWIFLAFLLGAMAILAVGAFLIYERDQAPTQQIRPRRTGSIGAENVVKSGGDLQRAINEAKPGDTIVLEAGGTFFGPITLPKKSGAEEYVTIRTSDLNGIAKEGERVDPSQAKSMPKIVCPANQSAIQTADQAHHFKFIGIEFAPAADASYVYNLINLGLDNYKSASQFPHHLIFDRCYIHSTGLKKARRGLALNSAETSVINSYVSGFIGDGDETQALAGWNGPGPFHIINNYLEGGAEILLFGGADPSIEGLVPSDIEIRRNHFFRPKDWQGRGTIKGNFELKNARRVVIDGNLIDSEIRMTAFVLTVRNQNGNCPWCTIEDVEVTNNVVKHASTGINILGLDNEHPSQEAKRIKIANNLFMDLAGTEQPYFLQVSGGDSVTVDHNTVQQSGNIISGYGSPTKNFVFTNNIVQFNNYGIACFIEGPVCDGLKYCRCFARATLKGNLIADNLNQSASFSVSDQFPPGNFVVTSYQKLGFLDFANGDWRLQSNSPYRKRATDGKDPGVDFESLNGSGVVSLLTATK
ncbi:MAG TPA: hypothetical protein VJ372_09260 [Pyrinomonadaceae bacterium]|jgi:hypothetical protein|nr:hypothetical protein [Pyrinomonadaceae bacterium]